jgi:sigma-B regulation protein RsbU (phosphoserine phosphatase)
VSDPAIHRLVDRLLNPGSSPALVASIEEVLDEFAALPARLYLRDPGAGVYYAAAGLGCERDAPDLSEADLDGPRVLRLPGGNGMVGALALGRDVAGDHRLEALAALLGPVLLNMHRRQGTLAELQLVEDQVRLITSAGDLLRHMELEVLLVKILETVLGSVRAQVGALLVPGEGGALEAKVTWGLRQDLIGHLRLRSGRHLADAVMQDNASLLITGEAVHTDLDLTGLDARLTGILALPLATRGEARGVVLAANPEGEFGQAQQKMAETLCSLAAIALDNALLVKATVDRERLQQEMDLARSVQTAMSPTKALEVGGYRIEGRSRPCNETGGDYFTYLERGGRVLALIGDVSGHGLGAALFTTMAHAMAQQQLRSGASIDAAFKVLNEGLYHAQSGRFMTAAVVDLDPATGRFTYTSAGHNPLLWMHRGRPRWLDSMGLPLGIMPDSTFPVAEPGLLEPGDYLILYTDGYTEALNPANECFGEDRLAQTARNAWELRLDPTQLGLVIDSDTDVWAQGRPHADDLTMVIIAAPGR